MPVIKAGARKLHMHCNQRSFVETEFGSFLKLFAEIKFCVLTVSVSSGICLKANSLKLFFFFLQTRPGLIFILSSWNTPITNHSVL